MRGGTSPASIWSTAASGCARSTRKRGNADGDRRPVDPGGDDGGAAAGELPPLLRGMLNEQAATGLPPAWLPHNETQGR